MLFECLVVHVGQIFDHTIHANLLFVQSDVFFLGYSPLHKGVKCLDISTGRVYISRDVVFYENVFPFASLHPNAGALLRKEILLLPSDSSVLSEGVPQTDDHIFSIVPVTDALHAKEQTEKKIG
jgi:hypothetical protein